MRVYRSPLKLFVFGMIGIFLIAAAADVAFGHWISTPPESNNGVLTTRGQAQQRGDLMWGGVMVATGVMLFGVSITELVKRKPSVIIDGEGVHVDTGGVGDGFIPWEGIEAVSSGVLSDPFDGSVRGQLIIEMEPDRHVSIDAPGVTMAGSRVYVDAHDWTKRVTEVALAAQGAHDHYRRIEGLKTYEPPSMVWETTVDQPDASAGEQSEESDTAEVEE
ncbi:MAG: hypothetical protein ABFR95_00310 [Actinomycetota bacterium]